eukprot:TRINITY_DN38929_c0_g1_i1.p1 TRINITY_DN38929_c0_g1~~TRINITY_DN38929_c0_g1_i1.p1  ORF type:complete len:510 (+),score=76.37 TRINITY_DN38929_c0_g1_i1:234-1763(+)
MDALLSMASVAVPCASQRLPNGCLSHHKSSLSVSFCSPNFFGQSLSCASRLDDVHSYARHVLRVSATADGASAQVQERFAPDTTVTTDYVSTNGHSSGPSAPVEPASLTSAEVIAIEKDVILQTYGRAPIVLSHGKGSKLYSIEGKEYIDMAAGIAVNVLGHGDPAWVKAVTEQAETLTHVSNLYHTVPQVILAQRLVKSSFADRVFFANSGTEANEAAIKFSRKYQRVKEGASEDPATEFVAFNNCFHGRTMGAVALTYKSQYRLPFMPVMPGVSFADYGDLAGAAALIKKGKTAAVFVEPVQGEGGVFPATGEFLGGLRKLCDEAGALLVFDEVQIGLGRSGHLFAHEVYSVTPDIMTLAKPLAGGLPIGAVLMTQAVADAMNPGDHGSTFAGGPLVCHAANAVMDRLQSPGFLDEVKALGEYLKDALRAKLGSNPHVKEVRGSGLLVGVQFDVMAGPLVDAAREAGVLAITAGKGDVLRLAPPLVITREEIDVAVEKLAECLPVLG